ncbi:NYN domain-containing protein [Candidatus Kaiserbacteria bacterium]|nr:NYN domain-containing protein [Candidatus Kaiserbacteria bacterium]
MSIKTNKPNNYAFIDSQNLNLGIIGAGWKLDFARFRIYLKDKFKITKAFLFIGYVPGNEKLYTYLQQSGYICIFKPVLELPNKDIKGNVDAELVLHTMIQFYNFDQAVVVSGDGDFYCLVEYLVEQDKLLTLLVPNQEHYSGLFKKSEYIPFIKFVSYQQVKLEKRKAPTRTKPWQGNLSIRDMDSIDNNKGKSNSEIKDSGQEETNKAQKIIE